MIHVEDGTYIVVVGLSQNLTYSYFLKQFDHQKSTTANFISSH